MVHFLLAPRRHNGALSADAPQSLVNNAAAFRGKLRPQLITHQEKRAHARAHARLKNRAHFSYLVWRSRRHDCCPRKNRDSNMLTSAEANAISSSSKMHEVLLRGPSKTTLWGGGSWSLGPVNRKSPHNVVPVPGPLTLTHQGSPVGPTINEASRPPEPGVTIPPSSAGGAQQEDQHYCEPLTF